MNSDQIRKIWNVELVQRLRDHCGLPEEEAREKTEAWFNWLQTQYNLQLAALAGCPSSSRPNQARSHLTK
jgi:hypothetical protein